MKNYPSYPTLLVLWLAALLYPTGCEHENPTEATDRVVEAIEASADRQIAEDNQNSVAEREAFESIDFAPLVVVVPPPDSATNDVSQATNDMSQPDPDQGLPCNGPNALGEFGYVQKPNGDSDGNLVFLWPSSYQNILSAVIVKANGDVLERGTYVGRTNDDRPTVRFSMPGCGYTGVWQAGGLRVLTSPTETCTELGRPCDRHE